LADSSVPFQTKKKILVQYVWRWLCGGYNLTTIEWTQSAIFAGYKYDVFNAPESNDKKTLQ
jgi:hypothetical protein